MDELDRKITGILQQDGRESNASIARKLNVSEGTVRRRLKNLIKDKAIQILALPEPSKLGLTTEALVALQVDPGQLEEVGNMLANVPETVYVSANTGAFDIFTWVAVPSQAALHNFLQNTIGTIPGVKRSETFVNLSVKKRSFTPLS
jgi:Lrp/AsnC family transcriptional regulator for asnA, asnC and gidA